MISHLLFHMNRELTVLSGLSQDCPQSNQKSMQAECEPPKPYQVLLLALRPCIDGGEVRGGKGRNSRKGRITCYAHVKVSHCFKNSSCPTCTQD